MCAGITGVVVAGVVGAGAADGADPVDAAPSTIWGAPTNGLAASTAFVDGALLATDYVYDDRSVDYPDEPRYAGNAADIVEARIRRSSADRLEVGVLLNALVDADVPIVEVGFDDGSHHRLDAGTATVDTDANTLTRTIEVGPVQRMYVAAGIATDEGFAVADLLAAAPEAPEDWQQRRQARVIASGRFLEESLPVDLSGPDRPPPDRRGRVTRIFRSGADVGEGIGTWTIPTTSADEPEATLGEHYLGPFQPYELWVPPSYAPGRSMPLFTSMHGFGGNHFTLGSWADGTIDVPALAVSPLGRGPYTFFAGPAELDVLEVLADVARHYAVDPDRVHLSGTSMGGQATYRLGARYPDRFATAVPLIGTSQSGDGLTPPPLEGVAPRAFSGQFPSGGYEALHNFLNLPLRIYNGQLDWLVNNGFVQRDLVRLTELGYDFTYSGFTRRHHEVVPAYTDVLYEEALRIVRDRTPARVVYRSHPWAESPELGLLYRGAYWVSDMEVRPAHADDGYGHVDAVSHALAGEAKGAPELIPPELRTFEPTGDPYEFRGVRVPRAPGEPRPEAEATLTHLAAVTFDVGGAGLDAARPFAVILRGDGPTEVTLAGRFPGGTTVTRDGRPFDAVTSTRAGLLLAVDLSAAPSRFEILPAREGGGASPRGAPADGRTDGGLPATGGGAGIALLAVGLGLLLVRHRRSDVARN